RVIAGGMDRDRVGDYIRARGGQLVSAEWEPFGPGWFGDKSDRIYEVRYVDRQNDLHVAHCKTSLFSGVYLTEDRIVSQQAASRDSLEEENRRLREEVM